MNKLIFAALVSAAAIPLAAVHAAAQPPKISKAQAEAIALKLAPGKIKDAEYEKEGGVWRWSFDIQQKGHIQEIGIDGQTGKVVENSNEGKVDHD
ncbi:PepSY domain-containing protein [Sphingomonas sp. ASV193]|uniref:PepSY domain-containing protein n=1 Tax=Sphingomonas sp. ASV193 TaxID=3144405 RepID=UPI0032E8ABDF